MIPRPGTRLELTEEDVKEQDKKDPPQQQKKPTKEQRIMSDAPN